MIEKLPVGTQTKENGDVTAFIARHQEEILGMLEDSSERDIIGRIAKEPLTLVSEEDRRRLDDILERFETKIFEYEKTGTEPGAKRVLVTSNDPGSWGAMKEVTRALAKDTRVRGVIAAVSGIAGKEFETQFPDFVRVREEETVLGDAISHAEEKPTDIAIASVSTKNGPENLALYGAKGNLGAKRTYLVFEGYGSPGGAFKLDTSGMEQIDGIFCNDEFSKKLIERALPDYPPEHIRAVGPLLGEDFELDRADEYRRETRKKLGITHNAFTVLYGGGIDTELVGGNGNIATLKNTLKGMEGFSEHNDQELALIIRPHPRDQEKEKLLEEGVSARESFPVRNGSAPLSFNEVIYAADVFASIISTENLLAPLRGKRGIFLAYGDIGMEALKSAYGPRLLAMLEDMENVAVVSTPAELTAALVRFSQKPPPDPPETRGTARRMVNQILEGEKEHAS